jgi:phytoene synthase
MTTRAASKDNGRMFCWEQIAKTNRVFRISQVFASRHCVDRLLPVYALFSVVEHLCSGISDEDVARSKLNWWRTEYLQNEPGESHHPVMKELHRTGAMNDLRRENVAQLLDGAESRLYASAPSDMEALKRLCVELQRPQLELEIDASGLHGLELEFEPGLLARNGLLQLIRESVHRKEQGGFWWVPLNSLARHGVSREEISGDPESRAVAELMVEVLAAGESWGRESISQSRRGAVDFSPVRHIFAINGLYSRKLKRLGGLTPNLMARELGRLGPADIFEAWKCARQLQKNV